MSSGTLRQNKPVWVQWIAIDYVSQGRLDSNMKWVQDLPIIIKYDNSIKIMIYPFIRIKLGERRIER